VMPVVVVMMVLMIVMVMFVIMIMSMVMMVMFVIMVMVVMVMLVIVVMVVVMRMIMIRHIFGHFLSEGGVYIDLQTVDPALFRPVGPHLNAGQAHLIDALHPLGRLIHQFQQRSHEHIAGRTHITLQIKGLHASSPM